MNVKFSFFSKILVSSWLGFFCFSADEKYVFLELIDKKNEKDYRLVSKEWFENSKFSHDLKKLGFTYFEISWDYYLDSNTRQIKGKNLNNGVKSYSKNEIFTLFVKMIERNKPKSDSNEDLSKSLNRLSNNIFFYFHNKIDTSFLKEIIRNPRAFFAQKNEKKGKKITLELKTFSKKSGKGILTVENEDKNKDPKGGKGDKKKKNKYIYGFVIGAAALLLGCLGGGAFFLPFLSSKEKDEEKKKLQK